MSFILDDFVLVADEDLALLGASLRLALSLALDPLVHIIDCFVLLRNMSIDIPSCFMPRTKHSRHWKLLLLEHGMLNQKVVRKTKLQRSWK